MDTEKITFVLGAGASIAMGYPLGSQLRTTILKESSYRDILLNPHDKLAINHFSDFIDAFRKSQLASIDAFLARRLEFAEIGKEVISAILLAAENYDLLSGCEHSDNWYYTFYQTLVSYHTWESLDLSHISIVSFNYDRSFEHYLMHALSATFGKPWDEAWNKIQEMNIVHVYGLLESCNPSEQGYRKYGSKFDLNTIKLASRNIKVIPESRESDPTFELAKQILSLSDRIAFLGFGFDDLNLKRLESKKTCISSVSRTQDTRNVFSFRKIVATCFGLTVAERSRANGMTAGLPHQDAMRTFLDCTCTELLRQTLIALQTGD